MSDQKNWDAALIKTWRTDALLMDTVKLFNTLSGKEFRPDMGLLRTPPAGYPWKHTVRGFVAARLSKISNRLWDQAPSKDILLLRKLETSKYDTEKDFIRDNERANAILQSHRDTARTRIVARKISERNNATDWNKVS
jgi:hypothetical protein